jgi:predicted RNase H-like HicB family nuclease
VLGKEVASVSEHRVVLEVDADGNWLAGASDIRGCHSYGRSLSEARKYIREAIALFVEESATIELAEEHRLPKRVRAAINACHQARRQAANATESAIDATAATAHFLSREVGLGTRDIGELLGISHQRVAQLLAGDAA